MADEPRPTEQSTSPEDPIARFDRLRRLRRLASDSPVPYPRGFTQDIRRQRRGDPGLFDFDKDVAGGLKVALGQAGTYAKENVTAFAKSVAEHDEAMAAARKRGDQKAWADLALAHPVLMGFVGSVTPAVKGIPGLYSSALKALEDAPFKKGTAQQWLARPGIKEEELEYTGLPEYLLGKQGSISKREVLEHIDQKAVRLEETVLGGEKLAFGTAEEQATATARLEAARQGVVNTPPGGPAWPAAQAEHLAAQEAIITLGNRLVVGDTKFAQWQLPGGENYRELLIRLPGRPARKATQLELERGYAADAEGNVVAVENGMVPRMGEEFRGGHYKEPNVLVHVRFNERVDADGNRYLFIEEVQSDWHQKGRTQGYARIGLNAEETARLQVLEAKRGASDRLTWDEMINAELTPEQLDAGAGLTQAESGEYRGLLNRSSSKFATGVPDAPFKKTWPDLALKRMIHYAAKNGFDRIAWTTGAQQAKRYDLSKHIEAVYATQHRPFGARAARGAGSTPVRYDLEIMLHGRRRWSPDGRRVIVVAENNLPAYVGKDLADKIIEQGGGQFRGLDLKVGGEGMKSFYDRRLVNSANKIGKKYGAKVGKSQFDFLDVRGDAGGFTAHSMVITPELKAKVLKEGLPLFKDGGFVDKPLYNRAE